MRSIDLDSLDIFRTVVQEGGVIRAAQKLNRVQSNVTTRIKQLEQRLGRSLFRKQGRGLVLSPEGELLLSYAQRLFRLADEAESELKSGRAMGVFRIGSLESTAGSRLAPLLSRFHRQHPGVVVELVTGTTGAVLPARTLEFASYQAMIACVAAGTGFAMVPRSLLVALKAAHDVQQHELPARVRRNRTHLVWNGTPSTALQRLMEITPHG